MPSLGALQPDAAAMFQEAFDEAVGLNVGKELENIRSLLEPKLGIRGVPLSHLRSAFKLAHGVAMPPISTPVASDGRGKDNHWIEPHPRDAIANYLNYQMMYVSGETGEPSVETTGIIEDIVRQQVIEIVSAPISPTGRSPLTAISAPKLHRAGLASRVACHHHQRPHLPDPR